METLKLEKSTALRIFKKASDEIKEILKETFGPKTFSENILDRINSFEDVLSEASKEDLAHYHRKINQNDTTPDEIAYQQLKLICNVAWEGIKVDYTNTNQKKWYPWFRKLSSGLGFGVSFCVYDYAGTAVGSRLCFPSKESSDKFSQLFIDIYNKWLF